MNTHGVIGHNTPGDLCLEQRCTYNHLWTSCVFSHHGQRKYPSFFKPKNILCMKIQSSLTGWSNTLNNVSVVELANSC